MPTASILLTDEEREALRAVRDRLRNAREADWRERLSALQEEFRQRYDVPIAGLSAALGEAHQGATLPDCSFGMGGRWHGMRLGEAVAQLLHEHPTWAKEEVQAQLERDGFDFEGKDPTRCVHMALLNSRPRQRSLEQPRSSVTASGLVREFLQSHLEFTTAELADYVRQRLPADANPRASHMALRDAMRRRGDAERVGFGRYRSLVYSGTAERSGSDGELHLVHSNGD
jgi:hypothetical protein